MTSASGTIGPAHTETPQAFAREPIANVVAGLHRSSDWSRVARVLVLVFADLAAISSVMALAYLLWAGGRLQQPLSIYAGLVPAALLLFAGSYLVAGLYPGFGLGPIETLRRLTIATTAAFTVLAAAVFVLKLPHVYSRLTIGLAYVGTLVLLPLARSKVSQFASRRPWWGEPIVVVGRDPERERLVRNLLDRPSLGYRPVVALEDGVDSSPTVVSVGQVPVLGGVELAHELSRHGIRVAVLVQDDLSLGPLGTSLRTCFPNVIVARSSDDVPVEHVVVRNLGNLLGIEYSNRLLRRGSRFLKRAMDLLLGSVGLAVASPVVVVAAVFIKLCDHGPVFFSQERGGMGGRTIRVWKLRTMRVDAERQLETHLNNNARDRRTWKRAFKLENDPRVIPFVGRFLRRHSIDELPQLMNVIRGDMSLVGPRPLPDYHLRRFPHDAKAIRSRVRPGLTGPWQVSARGRGEIAEFVAHDAYYIRNWSLWLDVYLIARTVSAVLTGRGAV